MRVSVSGRTNRVFRKEQTLEVVTIDARVVVAGVDAYLRFAEMCGRLDLTGNSPRIGRSLRDGALPLELPGRARTEIG